MKNFFWKSLVLVWGGVASVVMGEEMKISSNVLINFGDMEENTFDGTWNHQKGTETGITEWDRYTADLQDAASVTTSDIEVKFGKVEGRADALESSCHDLMAQTYGVNLGL